MNSKRMIGLSIAGALALAGLLMTTAGVWAGADRQSSVVPLAQADAVPSTISYQGRLLNADGTPVEGMHMMAFRIYAQADGGAPLWSASFPVSVEGGLFHVTLDVDPALFNGQALWLGVQVEGDAEEMMPRQPLLPAPYALHALSAPWTGLTGVPAGLDDGDDDTTYTAGTGLGLADTQFIVSASYRLPQSCGIGEIAEWNGSSWGCDGDDDTTYTAGTGLSLVDTQFRVSAGYRLPQSCSGGQIAEWNGSSWQCGDDNTGPAGWSLTGNSGTDPTIDFLGTADGVSLTLAVSGTSALRLEPNDTSPNLVGGNEKNSVAPGVAGAVIGGGGISLYPNRVTADYATVGGGVNNFAIGGTATVGGGIDNTASGEAATVSGGAINTVSGDYATLGGGTWNTAGGYVATVGGGYFNTASGHYATIGGGSYNTASYDYATVGGGVDNFAIGDTATVGGGLNNTASGEAAVVGGGRGNVVTASGSRATVGGGESNVVSATHGTIAGGRNGTVTGDYATVGGGYGNTADGYVATVGGGYDNLASDVYDTVGGGYENLAGGGSSTIGGGQYNEATAMCSIVGGGESNTASGDYATIGGGQYNEATAMYATVGGGYGNTASGDYSFAAGEQASATHDGSFVWASDTVASSWGANTFTARTHGGARFYSASGTGTGVQLSSGGSSWASISDRNAKENFADVNAGQVLETLAAMPIQTWNLRAQPSDMRHVGPVAQDFNGEFAYLFGEVESPTHINNMDAIGVALVSVQGLYAQNQELTAENAALRAKVDDLEARVAALEAAVGVPPTSDQVSRGWLSLDRLGLLLLGGLMVVVAVVRRRRSPGGGP